jgi:SAM-dependent methyltransferase
LIPTQAFSLSMLYQCRCFSTVSFSLGVIQEGSTSQWIEALACCIGSPRTREIMLAATEGAARYRLDFPSRGHQRGTIRQVVDRAYTLSPEILNDARQAPWSVDVLPTVAGGKEDSVELRPRLYPDPRLFYRQDDIAAASHPPLAACMARLAEKGGVEKNAVIWDPFCGSGLELIESALRGGVAHIYGTDLDAQAIEVARENFAAARLDSVTREFICCDFRDARHTTGILPSSVSLIITNPPLGRRVRIKDMQGLFSDFTEVAFWALRPGGRLIFVNPLRTGPSEHSWKREYRQLVDLGGFNCHLEMYRKLRG